MKTDWTKDLTRLLTAVAAGKAGQAATVTIGPPDDRTPVKLVAARGEITVVTDGPIYPFGPHQAAEAVSQYVSLVEGNS